MKLEQQVTSLELSKRLKELGVKQEYQKGDWCYETIGERLLLIVRVRGDNVDVIFPFAEYPNDETLSMKHSITKAFTVAELGEMLPETVNNKEDEERFFNQHKASMSHGGNWQIRYGDVRPDCNVVANILSETEAEARGKMMVYLLENGVIKRLFR